MSINVLTVGVAVIDFVMNLDEMPCRAEKYRANDAAIVGGGCGANAAVAISRLGGECDLVARLGDDQIGDLIISGLRKENVNCDLARQFSGCRSSFSSIFIDRAGERQIVNYRDFGFPACADWLLDIPFSYDAVLADTRWPEGAEVAMKLAKSNGVPGIVDAEPPFDGTHTALELASHVAFSAQGLRSFTSAEDLPSGLEIANARLNNFVCVTDGPNGVWWMENQTVRHKPAFNIVSVDTLGAGDVWHGAFALKLGENSDIELAIEFSNAVAALKCMRHGGREGTPSRNETDSFIRKNSQCN
ncbi:MAG: sugar kinase [Rhodospirillales bacterium]|nr:sugar kinase [Rhodospirillales bacterium]